MIRWSSPFPFTAYTVALLSSLSMSTWSSAAPVHCAIAVSRCHYVINIRRAVANETGGALDQVLLGLREGSTATVHAAKEMG